MKKNKNDLTNNFLSRMKEISQDFWSIPSGEFEEMNSYYTSNLKRYIANANVITDKNPKEVATFWSELIRTDFIIKFGIESQNGLNFKKEIKEIKDAVLIIKNVFENAYQYFGFYTISNSANIDSLYNLWYKPYKAKELATDKEASSWKINGKKVSGKYWVLNNCQLLEFSEVDIKWMKHIRDAESHENLVYTIDGIAILEGDKTKELKKEDVIYFAKFLRECLSLIFHFSLTFIIRERFWIFLAVFIVKEDGYKNSKAPFYLLEKARERVTNKMDVTQINNPFFQAITTLMIKYSIHDLWNDIQSESNRLNNRLKIIGYQFDSEKIKNLRLSALCDLYNLGSLFIYKTKIFSLGIQEDFKEVTLEEIDNANFDLLFAEIQKTASEVLKMKNQKENKWLLLSIILGIGLVFILPISKLYNGFNNLLIPLKMNES